MRTIYIDEAQVEAIRASLSRDAWLALWIASETGLRVGDIVSLKKSQIGAHAINFRAQKTGKEGIAHISAELRRAILASFTASEWVFPMKKDPARHITRQAVWARVKAACKRAGIDPEGIGPHSFRKHFAVELFKRSGLKATQTALQHDRAVTTELYALSDFSTGTNAEKPLLRRDLPFLVEIISAALRSRVDK